MKRKGRKKKKFKIIILLAVFIAAAILGFHYLQPEKSNQYEMDFTIYTKNTNYLYSIIENKIIVQEENLFKIYEDKTEKEYILKEEIANAEMYSAGNTVYIINKKNGKIYAYDLEGNLINRISLNKEVISIKEDVKKQYIGLHTREKDGTEQLVFFDDTGKETGRIDGIKDGKIIDYTFDAQNKNVAISAVTYNKKLKTNIMLVDTEGNILSGKIIEDEIFPKIYFTEDESILCIGERKIIKLSDDKQIEWERNIEADNVQYTSKGLIICRSQIGKTEIIIIDENNNKVLETSVRDNIQKIKYNNQNVIFYGKDTLYELENNMLLEAKLSKNMMWADLLYNGKIVIGSNKKIKIIKRVH